MKGIALQQLENLIIHLISTPALLSNPPRKVAPCIGKALLPLRLSQQVQLHPKLKGCYKLVEVTEILFQCKQREPPLGWGG